MTRLAPLAAKTLAFFFLSWSQVSIDAQDRSIGDKGERGHGLSIEDVDHGWISLFDGTTLFGWNTESDANWRAEDGCIVVDQGTQPGLLRTFSQFDQYELQLEFQADAATNSGVFVRTSPRPTDPLTDCYEINIAPKANPFPTGSIVGRQKTAHQTSGEGWHTLAAEVFDDHVRVEIDGQETSHVNTDAPSGRGHIGLQFNSGAIRFRNVKLRPRGLPESFNGRDLGGWKIGEGSAGTFGVTADGVVSIHGGSGYLESEAHFADFICQFKCRTNAPGINTGLFFRCIPGEKMNGYEVQIDNTIENGDRSKPVNGGTGCIFRRNTARRVVGNDQEWMTITLIAVGPRISVWVNGYHVTEFKDERVSDPNPRIGQRLDAGSLMLQAHDETTDVHFADFQIAELGPRQRGNEDD